MASFSFSRLTSSQAAKTVSQPSSLVRAVSLACQGIDRIERNVVANPRGARARVAVLVQNADDRATIVRLGIDPARITLIPGSGVDVERFKPTPEPAAPVTVAFAGRLLESQGVRHLGRGASPAAGRGRNVRLAIAGLRDPANPRALTSEE